MFIMSNNELKIVLFSKLSKFQCIIKQTLKIFLIIELHANINTTIELKSLDSTMVYQVIDISEIKFIKDLGMLRDLNLLRNPIQQLPDYRLLILFRIPKLKDLDRKKVDVKEKVSSNLCWLL